MKYQTFEQLAAAAKSGEFTGTVIVDNDCVHAFQPDADDGGNEMVFNFNGEGPEGALVELLNGLGVNAERA